MNDTKRTPASLSEIIKSLGTRKKVENSESILNAYMGSYYPGRNITDRVTIRFIELTGPDEATMTIRVGNNFYSTTVKRDKAFASADALDIVVENGQFRHISEKIVADTDKPVELITLEIPPDTLEQGEEHAIALYAPKNTVIRLANFIDTVKYRTIYHLTDGTSKFIVKTIGNTIFEHTFDNRAFGSLAVPGDFTVFEDSGYVSLVTMRAMPFEGFLREEDTAIVLPEAPRTGIKLGLLR